MWVADTSSGPAQTAFIAFGDFDSVGLGIEINELSIDSEGGFPQWGIYPTALSESWSYYATVRTRPWGLHQVTTLGLRTQTDFIGWVPWLSIPASLRMTSLDIHVPPGQFMAFCTGFDCTAFSITAVGRIITAS